MTRRERRSLLAGALALAVVCSVLFARAVLAQRAADLARAQARAALLPAPKSPASDLTERKMLEWTGASEQTRYWQALQRFRNVSAEARRAAQNTLVPLPLVFRLGATETALKTAAAQDHSGRRRSRLEDMLGLTYYYDATLHLGEDPIEPELDGKAIVAFRRAVILDSSNEAAKTNLEWLLRNKQERQRQRVGRPKLQPGLTRAQNAMQSAIGLPSQNGSVGRHFAGGY
jgi:hypothetical protein